MYTRICKIWGEFSYELALRKFRKMTKEEKGIFKELIKIRPNIIHVEKKILIGEVFYKTISYRDRKDYGDEEIFSEDLKRSTGEARRVKSLYGITLLKKKFDEFEVVILRSDFEKKTLPATKIWIVGKLLILDGGKFDGYIYDTDMLELKYMSITPDEFTKLHAK